MEQLKLENQLCFPLYAASREVIKRYKPYLDELDLTYTQYIAMMVLWEKGKVSAKELGDRLFLDSGTLTPLLKSLAGKGYVERRRNQEDERVLDVILTDKGRAIEQKAAQVPYHMGECLPFTREEAQELYQLLYKLLDRLE